MSNGRVWGVCKIEVEYSMGMVEEFGWVDDV